VKATPAAAQWTLSERRYTAELLAPERHALWEATLTRFQRGHVGALLLREFLSAGFIDHGEFRQHEKDALWEFVQEQTAKASSRLPALLPLKGESA
jgi:hypothetical protein